MITVFAALALHAGSRAFVQGQSAQGVPGDCDAKPDAGSSVIQSNAKLAQAGIDPRGYKLNIVIFYDDSFKSQVKDPKRQVDLLVKHANSFFAKESLDVKIHLDVLAVEHAEGHTWSGDTAAPYLDQCSKLAKAHKIQDANNYICVGGKPTSHSAGGVAYKGSVCDKATSQRVAYVQWMTVSTLTEMPFPSQEEESWATAVMMTHEIGRTLGMDKDFEGQDPTNLKKSLDGEGYCKGIMDYTETTIGWSSCSNGDLKKYLNGLKKICLVPIGTPGRSTEWTEGVPGGGMPSDPGDCKPPLCIQ